MPKAAKYLPNLPLLEASTYIQLSHSIAAEAHVGLASTGGELHVCFFNSHWYSSLVGEWYAVPLLTLKVHKNNNLFGFDFEFCTNSLLVMLKY